MLSEEATTKRHSTAERYAALSRIGAALMSELDESRLLRLIAETARELTNASFAAFTLRPADEEGRPLVASEGNLFHLAAVVGVTKKQEELFRRMPLGGEGLLAPIFRQGVPVLVPDALTLMAQVEETNHSDLSEEARQAAIAYAHGHIPVRGLRSMGVPRGHPVIRSFLGTPLLDRNRQVRGGLLLGHTKPGQFTQEDEVLLVGLAAQAAVALENARLYRAAQMRAQELNAIFESIADGVTLVDGSGNILRENGTARRLREILKDLPEGEQAIEALLQKPARHALHGEVAQGIEVTIFDKQKEVREYLVNASPLCFPKTSSDPLLRREDNINTAQKTISGAVVVWHDVTEARRLLIERRIHAETERLKDEFIAIAAHELRNPLAILKGFSQTLLIQTAHGKGPELADWQKEALQSIDQSTLRLVELIDDLLDVTRLQAGRLELHMEPTDLVALTQRVVARFQITTEQHQLRLHTSMEHLVLYLDPRRIEQVLSNLINNAIKYSPLGGPIDISFSEDEEKGMALLSIRDQGIGIPTHQQAHVFGRFVRGDNVRTYGISGTGLGLYLCRELIERHGGRIWFASTEGQGSTFYVALPVQPQGHSKVS